MPAMDPPVASTVVVVASVTAQGMPNSVSPINPLPVRQTETVATRPSLPDPLLSQSPSRFRMTSTAGTNAMVVKGSVGKLLKLTVSNGSAFGRWVKLYTKATVPAPANDAGLLVASVFAPPVSCTAFDMQPHGDHFANGIALAVVGGSSDTDATAIGANEVTIHGLFV